MLAHQTNPRNVERRCTYGPWMGSGTCERALWGSRSSRIMDAFASKGATQSLFGSGSPFSCPGILFGGPVAPGAVLFSSTPVIDSTESGPSPTDVNRGTSYIAQ